MKLAKGYFGRKKNVWTVAKNQIEKSWQYAYRDRRQKKREFRKLWIQRINAAARELGYSYSRLMGMVKNSGIDLNRKVLADLAMNHPEAFKAVVDAAVKGGNAPAAKKAAPKKETPKKETKAKKEEPKVEEPKAEEPEAPAEEPAVEPEVPAEEPVAEAEEPAAEAEEPAAEEAEAPAEEGGEEENTEAEEKEEVEA